MRAESCLCTTSYLVSIYTEAALLSKTQDGHGVGCQSLLPLPLRITPSSCWSVCLMVLPLFATQLVVTTNGRTFRNATNQSATPHSQTFRCASPLSTLRYSRQWVAAESTDDQARDGQPARASVNLWSSMRHNSVI